VMLGRGRGDAAPTAFAHRRLGPSPLRTPERGRRPPIARLEDLTKGALVSGILADHAVTVVDVTWHGSEVLTLTYRTADGQVAERLVYRDDEPRLAIVEEGKPWAFDGDGEAFKLVSETGTAGSPPISSRAWPPICSRPSFVLRTGLATSRASTRMSA
jgi:hypothetical protein